MNESEIVRVFRDNRMLITPSALEELRGKESKDIIEVIDKLKDLYKNYGGSEEAVIRTVTETDIKEATQTIKIPTFVEIKRATDFKPLAKEYGHDFKIHTEYDITGKSRCKGEISDFVQYFNERFKKIKNVLLSRPSTNRVVNIETLSKLKPGENARVICMITSKTMTKKGHMIVEVEDDSGGTTILVLKENDQKKPHEKSCFEKAQLLVNDEVVAIDVRTSTNFKIANDITWPDLPIKPKKTIEKDLAVAFISDVHVGSKYFCDAEFERMINWLRGVGPGKELAEKVGYLLVAGDVVDGIGIYPKQEKDLVLKDVYEQYKLFSRFLEMIPDHIEIIVAPGNHDAVRLAEPQPAIPSDMINAEGRVHSVGNPAYVDIEGLHTLLYHGGSLEAVIAALPGMDTLHPEAAAMELLKRRTLNPLYDMNDIAPEHQDYLFIEGDIDIFHTGHWHRNAYSEYRGTVVLNSGCWISQTDYQLKRGIVPTPAILPVYEMKSGHIRHMTFNSPEIKIV